MNHLTLMKMLILEKIQKYGIFLRFLKNSTIGESCSLGQNVVVGPNVLIGDRSKNTE